VGIGAMSLVVFAGPIARVVPALAPVLSPVGRIAWPWYVLIGTTITLATGMVSSLTHAARVVQAPDAAQVPA